MYYALLTIHFHNMDKDKYRDIESTILCVSDNKDILQNIADEWNKIKKIFIGIYKNTGRKEDLITDIEKFFNKYPSEKSDKIIMRLGELINFSGLRAKESIKYSSVTVHNVTFIESKKEVKNTDEGNTIQE